MLKLTSYVKLLILVQLSYMLFGGYKIGMFQWHVHTPLGQVAVFTFLAVLTIVSAAVYLWGSKWGFAGVMAFCIITIVLQSPLFAQVATTGRDLTGDPLGVLECLAWFLLYAFPVLATIFAYKAYREI